MVRGEKPSEILFDKEKCDLCGTCIAVCPPNVITIIQKNIYIDFNDCTYCSLCIDICPLRAIEGTFE